MTIVEYSDLKATTSGTDWRWFESFVFAGGSASVARLILWNVRRQGAQWGPVKQFLRKLKHDTLHGLAVEEVEVVAGLLPGKPTTHALADLRPGDGQFGGVAEFCPPFAIEYLLHDCLETLGRVPRWSDVKRYLFVEHRERYILPFLHEFGLVSGTLEARVGSPHFAALQWRIGNAYYSLIREIHLLTTLRQRYGLDVRYHVLADVEYKADLVAGDVLVAIYVPNGRYRDGHAGRKMSVTSANPGRRTLEVRVQVRKDFGRPWLVTEESVKSVAETLAEIGCPRL